MLTYINELRQILNDILTELREMNQKLDNRDA
jgi:hypothetical protein